MSRLDLAPAGKRATHALVVGIGSYPFCGPTAQLPEARAVRDLTSPPRSAHRFVDWLVAHRNDFDAPLASITLLADPLADSLHAVTLPTFDNVESAMQAWQAEARNDDCLVLYWCGHGFLDQNHRRLLLCADVGKKGQFWKYAVDNREDASKARASAARTQLWLIDACQDAAEELKLHGPNGRSMLPDLGTPLLAETKGKDIGVVLSSAAFQKAGAARGRESHFCLALQEALEWRAHVQVARRWLVRTTDLVAPINAYLAERALTQRCKPEDGLGQHPILGREQPPQIPATFVCDPAALQPEVTLAVAQIGPGTLRIPLHAQRAPSTDAWSVSVPAGIHWLSGRHVARGHREEVVPINPNVREGVLPW